MPRQGQGREMIADLVFDDLTHTYKLAGTLIPGVTSILKAVGLVNYDGIPLRILDEAAQRGSAVHDIADAINCGVIDWEAIPEELIGYADQFVKFKSDYGLIVVESETRVVSRKLRYGGTLDMIAVTQKWGDDLGVWDIKTTAEAHPGHAIQTVAYQTAKNEMDPTQKIKHRGCVYLSPNSYEVERYTDKLDANVWLSALAVYNYSQRKK